MPINLDVITGLAPSKTIAKGLSLFRDNSVVNVRRVGDKVQAKVIGSTGNIYEVAVEYVDNDLDYVNDYKCNCPAFSKYDGACKHIIATVLTVENHGVDGGDERQTSNSARELLIGVAQTRANKTIALTTQTAQVQLKPILDMREIFEPSYDYQHGAPEPELTFKIGTKLMSLFNER